MRKLSPVLLDAFKAAIPKDGGGLPPLAESLKWLRYYLDFCAKYDEPPRDQDSLAPFLQKLASKRQTPEQQKQAAAVVDLYYTVVREWGEAGQPATEAAGANHSWDACYPDDHDLHAYGSQPHAEGGREPSRFP